MLPHSVSKFLPKSISSKPMQANFFYLLRRRGGLNKNLRTWIVLRSRFLFWVSFSIECSIKKKSATCQETDNLTSCRGDIFTKLQLQVALSSFDHGDFRFICKADAKRRPYFNWNQAWRPSLSFYQKKNGDDFLFAFHLQGQGKHSQCKWEGIHPWQSFNWSIPPWQARIGNHGRAQVAVHGCTPQSKARPGSIPGWLSHSSKGGGT